MSEFAGAIAALNTAYTILKGALTARDDGLIRSAQLDLQEKLLSASTMALTQVQSANALELEAQQLRTQLVEANARYQRLEAQMEQRAAYALTQPVPGKWAYSLVGQAGGSPESTAYFCAACYAEHLEVPMQYVAAGPGSPALLSCANSPKHVLVLGGALPRPPKRASHSPGIRRDW